MEDNNWNRIVKERRYPEKEVREAICNIHEGGERAFEQRYKRIHFGD